VDGPLLYVLCPLEVHMAHKQDEVGQASRGWITLGMRTRWADRQMADELHAAIV